MGASPETSGDNLLPVEIGPLNDYTVRDVDGGSTHTCIVVSEINASRHDLDTLRCFGGWDGDKKNQMNLWGFEVALPDGVGAVSMDMRLPRFAAIDVGCTPEKISLGGDFSYPEQAHTCVVCRGTKEVRCFGTNGHGQLGTPAMEHANVTVDGELKSYCSNCYLGFRNTFLHGGSPTPNVASLPPLRVRKARDNNGSTTVTSEVAVVDKVSAGHLHTCVVTNTSDAFCFGNNDYSQCGKPAAESAPTMPLEIDCSRDTNLLECFPVDTANTEQYGEMTPNPPTTSTTLDYSHRVSNRQPGALGFCFRRIKTGWDHVNDEQVFDVGFDRCEGKNVGQNNDKVSVGVGNKILSNNDCRSNDVVGIAFVLPAVDSFQKVASAEFRIQLANLCHSAASFGVDLYGLTFLRSVFQDGADSYVKLQTEAIEKEWYYSGEQDPNATLLKRDFARIGVHTTDEMLSFSGPELTAWMNAMYAGGGSGKYVHLRLSPDSDQGCASGCQGTKTAKPDANAICGRNGNANNYRFYTQTVFLNISFTACTCGDGVGCGNEQCDDANNVNGDGCSDACSVETGFSCKGTGVSKCSAICGDGLKSGDETCDDGNSCNNDGCNRYCQIEDGFSCSYDATTNSDTCELLGNKDMSLQQPHSVSVFRHQMNLVKAVSYNTKSHPDTYKQTYTSVKSWDSAVGQRKKDSGNQCNSNQRDFVIQSLIVHTPQLWGNQELELAVQKIFLVKVNGAVTGVDLYAVRMIDNFESNVAGIKGVRYDSENHGQSSNNGVGEADRLFDLFYGPGVDGRERDGVNVTRIHSKSGRCFLNKTLLPPQMGAQFYDLLQ